MLLLDLYVSCHNVVFPSFPSLFINQQLAADLSLIGTAQTSLFLFQTC